jgi:hypothetical protein
MQQSRLTVCAHAWPLCLRLRAKLAYDAIGAAARLCSARETVHDRYDSIGEMANLVSIHWFAVVGLLMEPKVTFIA